MNAAVKKRVLIADDSGVVRRVITAMLQDEPALEIVGNAENGLQTLEAIDRLLPDLVILDVEMPELSGLEVLDHLRNRSRRPKILMFSSFTRRGAEQTLDALSKGAADYLAKPSDEGTIFRVQTELLTKVRALLGITADTLADGLSALPSVKRAHTDLVVIASSTGGPRALEDVFAEVPADFSVPIAIVQHMPGLFTKALAERLADKFRRRVVEVEDGMVLEPGRTYIAPGGFHVIVEKGAGVCLRTTLDDPENDCRPSADPLLRSAVRTFGAGVLAVVLTGLGRDGLAGCEAVKRAGGRVLVQDRSTSVVWSMPGLVASAGWADAVLPIAQIGREIARVAVS